MAGRFTVESVFKAVDRVTAPVSRMQSRVNRFTRSMERGLRGANRVLDKVVGGFKRGAMAAVKFATLGIGALTGAVLLLAREFSKVENAEAAFTPLLGGVERAKKLVDELNKTAATTPFQFETLAGAASQLLPVMNGDIEGTIKLIRMLGDTAGGNAQKLDSITRGFTKAMLKGKTDMESLNMIAEAGVPIFQDLASVIGLKTGPAFFKLISAGKVTTANLTKAFEKMTSEGGIFFRGMEIASKTQSGLWSTLKDNISLTAAELGGVLAPTIKDIIRKVTEVAREVRTWVQENKELINTEFLKFLDTAKKAVGDLFTAAKKLNEEQNVIDRVKNFISVVADAIIFLSEHGATILKIIAGVIALSLAIKVLTAVIWLVNVAMAANPVGLIVVGIAALIALVVALVIHWDDLVASFNGMKDLALFVVFTRIEQAADRIKKAWEPVRTFFADLFAKIERGFTFIVRAKSGAENLLGFGDNDESKTSGVAPRLVTPQERVARSIEETRSSSSSEVTIRDETGRAEVTKGSLGAGLTLQQSGAF